MKLKPWREAGLCFVGSLRSLLLVALVLMSVGTSCTKKARTTDPQRKVMVIPLTGIVPGLDLHAFQDATSSQVAGNFYDAPLSYHYLKRPYELVPELAESMPKWVGNKPILQLTLKKGVKFHDDPCFPDGKGREMVVDDLIYSIKRVADVNLNSPNYWFFEGKIKGLDAFRDYTKTTKTPDYGRDVEGLKKTGTYSMEFHLHQRDPLFLYSLTYKGASGVMPREAVEKYGDDFKNRAVGTGPFVLRKFGQKSGVIMERNPTYREDYYPKEGEASDVEKGLLKAAGKKLPFVDVLEFVVVMEEQPRMLKFIKAETDIAPVNKETFHEMINVENLSLKEKYAEKGMTFHWELSPEVWYTVFNLKDPFLGKHKKVRQAIYHAVNFQELSDLVMPGRLQAACDLIPPMIEGHDQEAACGGKPNQYDVEKAKKLLVEAGFPEGKGIPPLTWDSQQAASMDRQIGEYWKMSMAKIGIQLEYQLNTWAKFLEKEKTGQFQMLDAIWAADYPDAENFMLLVSGKHLPPGPNYSNYQNARYDQLFDEIRMLVPGPERSKRLNEMRKILNEDFPLAVTRYTRRFALVQSWVENFKPLRIQPGHYKYYDMNMDVMKKYLPMR